MSQTPQPCDPLDEDSLHFTWCKCDACWWEAQLGFTQEEYND